MNELYKIHRNWRLIFNEDYIELNAPLLTKSIRIRGIQSEGMLKWFNLAQSGATLNNLIETLNNTGVTSAEMYIENLCNLGVIYKLENVKEIDGHENNTSNNDYFSSQICFLEEFEQSGITGKQYQNNLKNSKVVILGMGGYGSQIAMLLSRVGVGNIIGIDYDVIEYSNLNRQILYSPDAVGQKKVKYAAKRLKLDSPATKFTAVDRKINTIEDIKEFLNSTNLLILPLPESIDSNNKFIQEIVSILKYCKLIQCDVAFLSGPFIGPLIPYNSNVCLCNITGLSSVRQLATETRRFNQSKKLGTILPKMMIQTSIFCWEIVRHLTKISQSKIECTILQVDSFDYTISKLDLDLAQDCQCN